MGHRASGRSFLELGNSGDLGTGHREFGHWLSFGIVRQFIHCSGEMP